MTARCLRRWAAVVGLLLTCAAPAQAVSPGAKHAQDPKRTGLPYESVTFPSTRDSVELNGWWFDQPTGAPVVVICSRGHGTMADLLPSVRELAQRGMAVLTFDYRDFGPGTPGPSDSLAQVIFASRWVNDAEGALRFARRKAPGRLVFVWGQDLGSAVAVAAASRAKSNADGVACEGLFRTAQEQIRWNGTSQDVEVQRRHRRLVDGSDEPVSSVPMLQVPLWVVYAGKDEVTPPNVTRDVTRYNLSVIERWSLPAAGHDGVELTPGYFDRLVKWIRSIAAVLAPPATASGR
ncbi:MAG: alpha/beta hydrolase [Candidatus Eisenbacteria bacterium]